MRICFRHRSAGKMDGADLGHRIAAVSKAFSGFSGWAHGGATCQANIPMAPPAGVVCGGGKSKGCGCGHGKRYWPGWMNESCSTGKRPFWTRPLCWRKRGLRSRKNPSRERYEVHGGGRRPGYTYRSATCVRADLRVPARGKHAGAGKSTARWTRPPAQAVAPCDCGSRLRFGWAAPAVVGSRHGVDRSLLAHQKTALL